MQILMIGGSGRTGRVVIEEALSKGHTITALVRKQTSLSPCSGLTIIEGTLTGPSIEKAIVSSPVPPSAVIVTLASVRASDSPFSAPISPPSMMTDAHIALIAAMKTHGIRRLVTMSAFGVGDSMPNLILPMRFILSHSGVAYGYRDHIGGEKVIRSSGLDWTIVKPAMLKDGERKEVTVWGNQGKGIGMMPKASRASVAGFLVKCAGSDEWNGMTPVIAD
ncbi:Flavin reductase (NADPH) [Lachnellula subtilissima]|uniref:Flavin reductase (NADPH) n=1 Tax=Lachnellula subtilissima TaxID=602034 RepID=A0A8H8RGR3_9HELO|nr:Flavin reductase (NADPH) [Lachnellula subtilissima]